MITRTFISVRATIGRRRDVIRGHLWAIHDYLSAISSRKAQSLVIFPQLGLGDQILLMGGFLELSKTKNVTVFITPNFQDFIEILPPNDNLKFEVCNEYLLNPPGWNRRRSFVRRYARERNMKYIFMGQELIGWMCRFRPDLSPTQNCYRIINVGILNYKNFQISQLVYSHGIEQYKLPSAPYAIVDSFTNDPREIPEFFIEDLSNRGLQVINNPRSISYLKLIELILGADEIHVTNSSMFCLSLVLAPKAKIKNIYLMHANVFNGHGLYDSSWSEIPIRENLNRSIENYCQIDRLTHYHQKNLQVHRFPRSFAELFFKPLTIQGNLLTGER